ncbi:hypothetical protein OPT61_g3659 [Boeremia exigua]|uniref:Uncharacterized protein n=1 Tax=Boeremia exigua TaxID=749465 RepID=A0ACC2IH94_9PLEO|nr:hypothetical protein OPT61_g3659 [Boeremia exigua]
MASSRDTERDMRRLAHLYNEVAMEQMLAMCWLRLKTANLDTARNVLEITAEDYEEPIKDAPIFDANVSEAMKKTFVSINQCIKVTLFNAGWLAYCAEKLGVELMEKDFKCPKRVHEVDMRYEANGEEIRTDYDHSVLLLISEEEKVVIVADASYAQYSFADGVSTIQEYVDTKVHSRESVDLVFGERAQILYTTEAWYRIMVTAVFRITNEVVLEELRHDGGLEAVLDMSKNHFHEALVRIVVAVKGEMEKLRPRLEKMKKSVTIDGYLQSPEGSKELQDLLDDTGGAGHRECMESYRQDKVHFWSSTSTVVTPARLHRNRRAGEERKRGRREKSATADATLTEERKRGRHEKTATEDDRDKRTIFSRRPPGRQPRRATCVPSLRSLGLFHEPQRRTSPAPLSEPDARSKGVGFVEFEDEESVHSKVSPSLPSSLKLKRIVLLDRINQDRGKHWSEFGESGPGVYSVFRESAEAFEIERPGVECPAALPVNKAKLLMHQNLHRCQLAHHVHAASTIRDGVLFLLLMLTVAIVIHCYNMRNVRRRGDDEAAQEEEDGPALPGPHVDANTRMNLQNRPQTFYD